MIKRGLLIITILLPLCLMGIGLVTGPQAAAVPADEPSPDAKPAQCFKLTGDPPKAKKINCSQLDGLPNTAARADFGTPGAPYVDDTCYLVAWGVFTARLGSEKCNQWREEAGLRAQSDDPSADGGLDTGFNRRPTSGEGKVCGGGEGNNEVTVSFAIGCRGEGNPIVDMTFAIIRFLSVGVGIIAVGSIILGGIQYTTSSGSPEKTAKAMSRISNTVIALLIYFLIFAILNWVVPGGVF